MYSCALDRYETSIRLRKTSVKSTSRCLNAWDPYRCRTVSSHIIMIIISTRRNEDFKKNMFLRIILFIVQKLQNYINLTSVRETVNKYTLNTYIDTIIDNNVNRVYLEFQRPNLRNELANGVENIF